jgi:hypothetical protein
MADLSPSPELREAAARMRQQARVGHPRPAFWSALADWLDRFSDKLYCYGPAEFDHALAIARAYLAGETR